MVLETSNTKHKHIKNENAILTFSFFIYHETMNLTAKP
ncbi:hypothetical protein SAMN05216455_10889 [Segatella bryantii]|nr:hypothetical protein SAMN04487899_10789 [Segatella bryantii]SEA52884.1 hypothetical protein SAMN05216455_10889 [Segatella bryantii]